MREDRYFRSYVRKNKTFLSIMCVLTPLIFYFGHQWGRHYYKSKIENMADKNGDGFSSDEEIRKEIVNVQSDAREFNDLSYWEMKKYVDDYRND